MPEGREGKLAESFSFALPPMNFHGAGGQGGAGFGGFLRSAEALLVYACQRVGRTSILIFIFRLRISVFLNRGWCFRAISTIGGGAFGGFMPLGRKGKRAAPFSFVLPPVRFHGSGRRGGAGFVGSILSTAALLVYACQRVGRASLLNFCFLLCLRRSIFPNRGVVFSGDPYNRRQRF